MKSMLLRPILAALFLLPLSGCLSLQSSEPPPATYLLHPRFASEPVKPETVNAPVLEIPTPEVPAGFDTDRIALYWDKGRRLDYYAAAKWPAPLDQMMSDFMIRSASQGLPHVTVVSPDLNLAAQYRLAIKVTEFQPVYKNAAEGIPDLYAAVRFSLIALPGEKVVMDFVIADYSQPSGADLTAITSGMESLLQSIAVKAFERLSPKIMAAPMPVAME